MNETNSCSSVRAPSVIKSLAKKLRAHSKAPPMTVTQSLEHMSQILGCPSWHAAQNGYKHCEPTARTVFSQSDFRYSFYTDLALGLQSGQRLLDVIQTMQTIASILSDIERKLVCTHLATVLIQNSLPQAIEHLNLNIPFEVLSLNNGLIGGNLSGGLLEARDFIQAKPTSVLSFGLNESQHAEILNRLQHKFGDQGKYIYTPMFLN